MDIPEIQTIPKILVADDERHNVVILTKILENAGYDIVGVESGEQAVEAASKDLFFIFILDINMKGISGFETAAKLRETEKNKNIPVIFVTGQYKEQIYVEEGYESGAVDYIIKPVNEKALLGKIRIFFEIYSKNYQLMKEIALRAELAEELKKHKLNLEDQVDEKIVSLRDANNNLIKEIINHEKSLEIQRKLSVELEERIKELRCLYGISKINEKKETTLEEVLFDIARLIPSGFQYPEIACVNINIWGNDYKTDNFEETEWSLKTDLLVNSKVCGYINVRYLQKTAQSFQGPFIKEDIELLNAVGERTGRIIERRTYELKLRLLYQKIIRLLEEERRRVARDLHDSIGQLLATLRLEVEWILKNPETEIIKGDLLNFIDMTLSGTDDLKRICMGLRPAALDKVGLTAAIEELLRTYEDNKRITIDSDIDKINNYEVSNEVAINTYRIIQESMNNIVKHADASIVTVVVQHKSDDIEVTIKDNGMGFDMRTIADKDLRLGLLGMKERTDICHGLLNIESSPGEGTSIYFSIPSGVEK